MTKFKALIDPNPYYQPASSSPSPRTLRRTWKIGALSHALLGGVFWLVVQHFPPTPAPVVGSVIHFPASAG